MAKAKSRSKAKKSKTTKKRTMRAKARPKARKAKAKAKPKKMKMKARPKAKPKMKAKPKSKRKPNPAFMKPLTPDSALAAIVGPDPLPRTEITKRLWSYIKRHGLQDAVNKRNINADEALKRVFGGRSSVTMFEMTKLVSGHMS